MIKTVILGLCLTNLTIFYWLTHRKIIIFLCFMIYIESFMVFHLDIKYLEKIYKRKENDCL